MQIITDKDQLAEVYAELDLEAAHDLLTAEEVDDLYEREKSPCGCSQGHSRYDEDGDILAAMSMEIMGVRI